MPDIEERIEAAVSEAVTRCLKSGCVCGLGDEARKEMPHVLGVIKDVGDGDYSRGAEMLREMLKFFSRADTELLKSMLRLFGRVDKAATWVARAVIVFIAVGVIKFGISIFNKGLLQAVKGLLP